MCALIVAPKSDRYCSTVPRPPRQRKRRPRPDLGARGYLYLLQFSNGVIKAGKTTDVLARQAEHEKEAARYDISVVNRWSSSLHDDVAILERRLVTVLGRIGQNTKAGKEYFSGVPFSVALHQAANIDKVASQRCCCGKCVEPLGIGRIGASVTALDDEEVALRLDCGSLIRAEFNDPDLRTGGRHPLSLNDHIEVQLEPTPFNGVWTAYYLAR